MLLSRRQFIAAGTVTALAACGGSSTSYTLAQRFPPNGFVPGEVRLAISLANSKSLLQTGPPQLTGRILDANNELVGTLTAVRRSDGILYPYWAFRPTITSAGTYTLRVNGDDGSGAAFQVFDPDVVTLPHLGSVLPPYDTPTVEDHRGVEPYCSLTPQPCPLHAVTLTDALKSGKPVVYMIGTPAHCQTGTCAPALELLVKTAAAVGDRAVFVHADVYADNAGTRLSPAVEALGLDYEPVLYLCAANGAILDRLDAVWDGSEVTERVTKLING